jgi:methylenetetrahydrofolate reductase (NADPH)
MRIDELLATEDRPLFSFEFFPPKSPEGETNLQRALRELEPLGPDYVSSPTAPGGDHPRDHDRDRLAPQADFGIEAMAHFTCVNATREELRATLDACATRASRTSSRCAATRPRARSAGRRPTAAWSTRASSSS